MKIALLNAINEEFEMSPEAFGGGSNTSWRWAESEITRGF